MHCYEKIHIFKWINKLGTLCIQLHLCFFDFNRINICSLILGID